MSTIIVTSFESIQSAIDSSSNDDTIIVKDGTYNERLIIENKSNLIIKAENERSAIIDGTGVSLYVSGGYTTDGLIQIQNSSNITIKGFQILHSTALGIKIYSSSYINIKNNYIYDIYSSGILSRESSYITIDQNEIEKACNTSDWVQEIISFQITTNYEISYNYVHDGGNVDISGEVGGEGIDAKVGSSNGTIHHNTVTNVKTCGIYVDAWDRLQSNIKVYNNLTYNIKIGIAVGAEAGGTLENVEVYNNVSSGCHGMGIFIANWNSTWQNPTSYSYLYNINVHHNTYYDCVRGIAIGTGRTYIDGLQIHYNLFSNNIIGNIIWWNRSLHTNVDIDHNYYDILKESTDSYDGTNYIIGGDPLFINPLTNDFRLQPNSPALGFGAYPYPSILDSGKFVTAIILAGLCIGGTIYFLKRKVK